MLSRHARIPCLSLITQYAAELPRGADPASSTGSNTQRTFLVWTRVEG